MDDLRRIGCQSLEVVLQQLSLAGRQAHHTRAHATLEVVHQQGSQAVHQRRLCRDDERRIRQVFALVLDPVGRLCLIALLVFARPLLLFLLLLPLRSNRPRRRPKRVRCAGPPLRGGQRAGNQVAGLPALGPDHRIQRLLLHRRVCHVASLLSSPDARVSLAPQGAKVLRLAGLARRSGSLRDGASAGGGDGGAAGDGAAVAADGHIRGRTSLLAALYLRGGSTDAAAICAAC
mmetsp:Transcript_107947/g.344609  ORF Transcript_107947/g.344609 Transcript_107947/m.344609 type:complete len:233 (+) Transcript_107947:847-1545(+)